MPILRPEQRKVLAFFDHSPELSVQELSRLTRMHSSKVQRIVRQLREEHGMSVKPFIDLLRTGLHDVVVYATLAPTAPAQQRKLVEQIRAHPQVSWLSYLIGDHQLAFAFFCNHLNELARFLAHLGAGDQAALSGYVVSPRISYLQFNRKHLFDGAPKIRRHGFSYSAAGPQLDQLDRRILSILANTAHESHRAVARHLGEAPATIDRRIQRLKDAKVLTGYIALIPSSDIGVTVYRLLLTCNHLSQQFREHLEQFCESHKQVVFLVETLGPFNFEIGIEVYHPREVQEIAQSLQAKCGPVIHHLQTYMEVEDLKWSFYPMDE